MSEENKTNETEVVETQVKDENVDAQTEVEKKYSDEDVNQIIDKKFAKWQKELEAKEQEKEEAVAEAERLAKMNAEDKQKYEYEKLQKELDEYKRKDNQYQMSKEANKMFKEKNINVSDDVLSFVVKGNADDTKKAVNAFIDLFNVEVEKGVKEALSGKSPRVNIAKTKKVTAEELKQMSYEEILEFKRESPERYKQLIKGE